MYISLSISVARFIKCTLYLKKLQRIFKRYDRRVETISFYTMEKLRDCLEYEGKYGYEMEYFWVSGVLLVVFGFLGSIGNILNLTILFRPTFRNDVIYQLLIMLSMFDTIYIFSYALDIGYYHIHSVLLLLFMT